MPINRKLLGAAAFSLALAGGGAAGAILGTPNLSVAQDCRERAPPTRRRRRDAGFRGPGGHGGVQLAVAAEAIGITEDELRTALEDGQSIAQVAEANGVDVQTVIDAMVAAATERLEAAIDELPDRMAEVVEREGLPDRGGPGGPGRGHFGAGLDAAADAIGIASEELRTALARRLDDRRGRRGQRRRRPDGDRRPRRRGRGRTSTRRWPTAVSPRTRPPTIKAEPPGAHRGHGERRRAARRPGGPAADAEADAEGTSTSACGPVLRHLAAVGALRGVHCRASGRGGR